MTPEEFWSILHNIPEPQPVFYRLYHDAQGRPLFYSMEDQPGTYIEIDQATFARSEMAVRVVNGQLQPYRVRELNKLIISDTGTPCSDSDVAVVDPESTTYWRKHTYVIDAN
mgnify:CR=1 FL=1